MADRGKNQGEGDKEAGRLREAEEEAKAHAKDEDPVIRNQTGGSGQPKLQ